MLQKDEAYRIIKRQVLAGTLPAGQRLSASEVADRHSLGISSVRAALAQLQNEGLVSIVPRVGFFVRRTTISDVRDMFGLRIIIEGAAAEMAASNITDRALADLETIGTSYVQGEEVTYLRYLKENREFHRQVALASGNTRLAELVAQLHEQMQVLLYLHLDFGASAAELMMEHQDTIQALRARDPEQARKTMVESICHTQQVVLEAVLSGSSKLARDEACESDARKARQEEAR